LGLLGAFSFIWTLLPFYFRKNVYILELSFLSFDRPEDRPFTLLWLFTQFFFSILVIITVAIFVEVYFGIFWAEIGLFVVCLAMIGNGLAEPIGVRFGRRRYQTYALFTKKRYFRTVEGSLTVFISTLLVVFLFKYLFTDQQFILALIILPVSLTLTEAFSSHTWDGPFLSGVSALGVGIILAFF
jgi:phytol kinase